jgi:molecular chaperone GrpE
MRPEEERQGPVIRDRRRIDPVTGQVRSPGEPGPQRGPAPGAGQQRPGRHSVSRPGSASASSSAPGADTAQPADAESAGAAIPGEEPGAVGAGSANGGSAVPATDAADRAGQAAAADARTRLAERTADLQRLQAEYANYRKRVERDRMAVREQALANVLHELLPVLDDIGRAREHGELTGGFKSVGESLEGIVAKLGLTSFGEAGDPFDPTLHEALMHSYSADVTEPTAVQILQPGYRVGDRVIRPARVAVAEPGGDASEGPDSGDDQAGSGAGAGEDTSAGDGAGEE